MDPTSLAPPGCYVVDTGAALPAFFDMASWNSATVAADGNTVTCRDVGNPAYFHGGCLCRDTASERRMLKQIEAPKQPLVAKRGADAEDAHLRAFRGLLEGLTSGQCTVTSTDSGVIVYRTMAVSYTHLTLPTKA